MDSRLYRFLLPLLVVACESPAGAGMVTVRIGSPPRGLARKVEKAPPERPAAYVPRADAAPTIDGRLSDAAWQEAWVLSLERTLDGQSKAAKATQVRLLHDSTMLYISARCAEPLIGKIQAQRRGHDGGIWSDDSMEIFLGRGNDYYHIGVNAAGATYDAHKKDGSWDSAAKVATSRGKREWTVELAVPLERMGAKGKVPVNWIANFNRNRYTSGGLEEFAWSPTYSGDSHVPARFGKLLFKEPPPRKSTVEAAKAGLAVQSVEVLPCEGGEGVVRFDLSALPKRARVYRADLRIFRTKKVTGEDDAALVDIEIYPIFSKFSGGKPRLGGEPLRLRGPWFDRFDATDAVGRWLRGKPNGGFFAKACPHWNAEGTCLDIFFDGPPWKLPAQVKGLQVFHRAGQTFITFEETDARSSDPSPSWADLKPRLENVDAEGMVRYLVFRHDRPINGKTIAQAELLAEVKPMSGYNVRGRSVDQLIRLHRQRAVDDLDFAKQLAKNDYFGRYNPDMHEMGEVTIQRLAVEDGKPLPPRTGLFVHHPKPGRSYYAVVSSVDGVANTRDFSPANSLSGPVSEAAGTGVPVLQGTPAVTVFFDYPGKRLHYVQWTAPPLSNLPNEYSNWGVFVPEGYKDAEVKRLSVFFHGGKQRYLKPPWPHRQDTVLISPHDAPFRSYGYGYHEALGTLHSFGQGLVRPFFMRRVDAMLDWAMEEYGPDAGRISCGGHGPWGGTAALQYALRRAGKIAYVMADGSPDPDPQQTPRQYRHYGRRNERPRQTHRGAMEAVWGKVEWGVKTESGKSVWEELSLPALVRAGPGRTMPYVSLGAGAMHVTWKQEADLMKAYLATGNAFMSEFFWGGSSARALPVGPEQGEHPFEPRADRPLLGCKPLAHHPNPKFFEPGGQFDAGRRGYGGGSRLCDRPRWDPEDIVDAPGRLEMTTYTAKRVSYAGQESCQVTVRNAQEFRPKPGEKVGWKLISMEKKRTLEEGEVTVGKNGLVVLPNIKFAKPARLILERRAAE